MRCQSVASYHIIHHTNETTQKTKLTTVVQVVPKLDITVTPRRDVKVTLDLVQIQTPKDAAAVRGGAPQPGRLAPAGALLSEGDNVVDVLLSEPFLVALTRDDLAVLVVAEAVHARAVDPLRPGGVVHLEAGGGHDAVPRGVLDVDVDVLAPHVHHRVHVDLHRLAHALFHGKGVRLHAAPPARQLGPRQDRRDEQHGHRPLAAA